MMLLTLIAVVLAIVALWRTRGRADLESRLARLEREIAALRGAPRFDDVPEPAPAPPRSEFEELLAPPAEPSERPSPPAAPSIDWERWLGVRAAAVLGGVALALASLLFFKYSIEHGLIAPWLRVVLGTAVGLGCVLASERLLRREYAGTANAVAGAGVATLYATFWAAHARYDLVGSGASFALMVAVTVSCAALAWRHDARVIAVIGLAGGFMTPLLLSAGSDRPIGLFGYLLLLDAAVLYVAERRRWPILAGLSLLATMLYQALWIGSRMDAGRLVLGLGILGVFAALFALAGRALPDQERQRWLAARAGGVLLPFLFGVHLAWRADLGPHLLPVAALLLLLSSAAAWLARAEGRSDIALAAAAGGVGVVGVWLARTVLSTSLAWEAAGIAVLLTAPFAMLVRPAAVVSGVGFFLLLIVASTMRSVAPGPWPWLAGWLGLAALLWRVATASEWSRVQLIAALGIGAGVAVQYGVHGQTAGFPPPLLYAATLVWLAIPFQLGGSMRVHSTVRHDAERSAALIALLLLLPFWSPPLVTLLEPVLFHGATLALGLLATLAATRLGDGRWSLAAVVATALVQLGWTNASPPAHAVIGLGMQGLAVVVFTAWPFLAGARARDEPGAWHAAALAVPLWFLSMKGLWEHAFGQAAIGLLAVGLGAVSATAAVRARDVWPENAPLRRSALAWFGAVALGAASVAVPLQLEREWITIGWALEGVAVTLLWRRLDHPGLKYLALGLLAATTVRLAANPAVLGYYPRSEWRLFNWLTYTYLVPAAALLGTGRLLHDLEAPRLGASERDLYRSARPLGALACGAAAIAVVFVWINLTIADWFATGATLTITFARLPARDLATSIAWVLYALLLLGLGVARWSTGLRWASLGLMLITIGKVFLHDLGELRDLYRVASLLGLAVSLICISLLYQRFVFRRMSATEA